MSRSRHHPRRGGRLSGDRLPITLHSVYDRGRKFVTDTVRVEKHWLSGCRGKVRFETERIAQRRREEAQVEHGYPLKVYRCRFCKAWHLATQPERERRELARLIANLEAHLRARGIDV